MAGSQGFIAFRLKPVNSIAQGNKLVNAADIFFDFNEPVRTNDAVLIVDHFSGITETHESLLSVFPNPVIHLLRVELIGSPARFDVIAADGRTVLSQRAIAGTNQLNTHTLTPGAYLLRVMNANGALLHTRFVKR